MLREVVAALDDLYPPSSAASWDRVGLVAGDLTRPVRRVLFAVDPTLAVIDEAVAWEADLLVTHHPLLLHGIHSVASTSAKGAAVTRLVENRVALFVAHTNADVAQPGVSSVLADALGLAEQRPLSMLEGKDGRPYAAGRVGELPAPLTLAEFAGRLAAVLPATAGGIRVSGDPDAPVQVVAVMGGAGDDRFDQAREAGAHVYVTADLRHHPVLEAREESAGGPPYLIDAGHWATESLWLVSVRDRLRAALNAVTTPPARVATRISVVRTEPWTFVVGANAATPSPEVPPES